MKLLFCIFHLQAECLEPLRSGPEQQRSPPSVTFGCFKSHHINNGISWVETHLPSCLASCRSFCLTGQTQCVLPPLSSSSFTPPFQSPSPIPADLPPFLSPESDCKVDQNRGREVKMGEKKEWYITKTLQEAYVEVEHNMSTSRLYWHADSRLNALFDTYSAVNFNPAHDL